MLRSSLQVSSIRRHRHVGSSFKKWHDLTVPERQQFVNDFVENYKKQYPGSKTNVSLKGLALDMKGFGDAPAVFGIFYNDIWMLRKQKYEMLYTNIDNSYLRNNIKEHGRFSHESFHDLLVEEHEKN
ncbi:Mlo1p Ecym_2680 [Eremothecium cymbalariae DBVPG|uniref:Uncharacterized protein n=1 Tax=Eremothecium cymbalariae (strain CBS 270.75 / DBVPG 7215 / KCTC 17166 / NRRL Y-17582) TaxID=931890 RepID=G8JNW5_ERECY|nr:Hypothetical protein Ecym_2680 [Eremothecium cymbalariae DBVPG\